MIKRRRRVTRRSKQALIASGAKPALPYLHLTPKKKVLGKIYHPEGHGQHTGGRFKWLFSTALAGAAGLGAIGMVMYVSMNMQEDGGSVVASFRQKAFKALETYTPKAVIEKTNRVGRGKTDRLIVTAKGLSTQYIIHDNIVQKRSGRDYIAKKPYIRIVATLATESPDASDQIPPFNPFKLYAALENANTDGSGAADNASNNISVTMIPLIGTILPEDEKKELSKSEVEKLVQEAGADFAGIPTLRSAIMPDGAAMDNLDPTDTASQANIDEDGLQAKNAAPARTTILAKNVIEDPTLSEISETRTLKVKRGATLIGMIRSVGAADWQAKAIIAAMNNVFSADKVQAGQKLRLKLIPTLAEDSTVDPVQVTLYHGSNHIVSVSRNDSGNYVSSALPLPELLRSKIRASHYPQRATLYNSVYYSALTQKLSAKTIMKMLRIHAFDTDFKQWVRAGDGIEAFFDAEETSETGNVGPGEMLYTAITVNGETRGFYRFRSSDGVVDYYDSEGKSAKKFLNRKPVRGGGVRLTSGFGYRFHPIKKQRKMHTGTDWAARRGTPILAAGSGTIEASGRKGGNGLYIRIRHANGYKTTYSHMNSIATASVKGAKIRQGQVIGTVGSTGYSTGPHLHFEVLVNNRQVDPMKIHVPRGRNLKERERLEFMKERARIDDLMRRRPVKTRVAAVN